MTLRISVVADVRRERTDRSYTNAATKKQKSVYKTINVQVEKLHLLCTPKNSRLLGWTPKSNTAYVIDKMHALCMFSS